GGTAGPAARVFYLGVIEGRCGRGVSGPSGGGNPSPGARGPGLERDAALAATTRRYCELMHEGEPVHTWPVGFPGAHS
ncbi:glutamate--cysteine ligase, partial [Streptomyces lunaelactis]|nr:glutamate--cysteine ligase [Streptomyces lunaelactis]